jgi:hypothetical protein
VTVRRGSRRTNDPETLAAGLPSELRSFDAWHYDTGDGKAHGFRDYLLALAVQVAPHEAFPVMEAAGLSAADWFRHMLTNPPQHPTPERARSSPSVPGG